MRRDELERGQVDERRAARETEVDREVRAPVDRDDETGLDAGDGLRGPLRIEVATAQPGPPPPDRNEPDVDRPELAHPVEEVGVAGEVDGLRALDDVADRIGGRSERPPAAVVLGRHDAESGATRWRTSRQPRPRERSRTSACEGDRRARGAARPGASSRAVRAKAGRDGRSAHGRRAPHRRRAATGPRRASSAGDARRDSAAAGRSGGERRRDRRRPWRGRRTRCVPSNERYCGGLKTVGLTAKASVRRSP